MNLPLSRFDDEEQLDEFLSFPSPSLVESLQKIDGDILIIGAGGKVGHTLARMAKRASPLKNVFAVSRFTSKTRRKCLENCGVVTYGLDILRDEDIGRLPTAKNVIYLAGVAGEKFRTIKDEAYRWAMNVYAPTRIVGRSGATRLVLFSTGCVYPFVPVRGGGATEDTYLRPPPSEYAMSCIGRERIMEYVCGQVGVALCVLRINYAVEMRYGVLHDIARKVWDGIPIDLTTGYFNAIWQGDLCDMALRSIAYCDSQPRYINITGSEIISVRDSANYFGFEFGKIPKLTNSEEQKAWLSNAALAFKIFGSPTVSSTMIMPWIADWVRREMPSLNIPTGYDGRP